MFRFPSPRLLRWWVGRSGKKKKNEWVLEGDWVPEKAGMLSKEAWLQSQLEGVVFSTNAYTVYKDKDITSDQLLLIKQDRVLVN